MNKQSVSHVIRATIIASTTSALLACGGSSSDPSTEITPNSGSNLVIDSQGETLDVTGTTVGNQPDNPATDPNLAAEILRLPSGGDISNPEFQWPATTGAASYRLVIEDHRGDHISQHVTADQANCLDESTACKFTPSVQIHDSILVWRTEAFDTSGEWMETSEDVAFNTLRSLSAQPYTSFDTIGAPPNPGHGFPTLEVGQYVVLNNDWNAATANSDDWQQTVAIDKLLNGGTQIVFEYDWLTREIVDEFQVKSYPQVLYGNKLGAHVSGTPEEIGLPATITALDEFKIEYSYQETGDAERNLAFESFFHTSCDIGGPNFEVDNREFEMMVWIANPQIRTPGSNRAASGVMIDNQLWDVWIKPEQDDKYIAFTAVNETASGTLNWNRFVEWTMEWTAANQPVFGIRALDPDWCMSAIEFGVEAWWGAGRLQLDNLEITRP